MSLAVIPTFKVFEGKHLSQEQVKDLTNGATVSVTKNGWSNSDVFYLYMTKHFQKYFQGAFAGDENILVLYDGYKSHISPGIIEWARQRRVMLFVLPAHTSDILQPIEVGCFGALEQSYNSQCQNFIGHNLDKNTTKCDIGKILCLAYKKAFTPTTKKAPFRRIGIYPINSEVIKRAPSRSFITQSHEKKTKSHQIIPDCQHDQPMYTTEPFQFFKTIGKAAVFSDDGESKHKK